MQRTRKRMKSERSSHREAGRLDNNAISIRLRYDTIRYDTIRRREEIGNVDGEFRATRRVAVRVHQPVDEGGEECVRARVIQVDNLFAMWHTK